GDLLSPRLDGLVELDPGGEDLLLGLDVGFPDLRVRLLAGLGEGSVGFRPDAEALLLDLLPEEEVGDGGNHDREDQPRRGRHRERCVHSVPQNCPGDAIGTGAWLTRWTGSDSSDEGYAPRKPDLPSRPLVVPIVYSPERTRGADASPFRRPGRRPVFE